MHNEGCCLGFDFGLKKIGVAVGQFITLNAQPLGVLEAVQGVPSWVKLQCLIKEWRPKCLVVGLPLAIDGQELSVTQAARNFSEELKKFNLPVFLTDERMTTKEAKSHLFLNGGYKALQKTKIDSLAAALILEQWLHQPHQE